jgi:phospho-N-acetylmuramoyl-pentapeptide-transferase
MKLVLVTAVSFFLGLAAMAALIRVLERVRVRQAVRQDGPESHLKKSGTLTMGGIGFFATTIAAALAFGVGGNTRASIVLVAGVLCFGLGFLDDFAKFKGSKTEGVKARYRFTIEILLGAALGLIVWYKYPHPGLLWVPWGNHTFDIGWLIVPFSAVVFAGTLNAVNFTDGLDGLLSGSALTTLGAYSFFLWRFHDNAMLALMLSLAGALGAFLWFNAHPARIFMGDTGSLFIGGILGAAAVLTRSGLFLVAVGFLYVAEALSVMIQVTSFRLTKKRVFRMSPIHHHFELAGWPETQVVVRFWIFSALCAGCGLWLFFR